MSPITDPVELLNAALERIEELPLLVLNRHIQ